jgi:hypothetical protein
VPVVLLVLVVCRRMPLLSAPAKPQVGGCGVSFTFTMNNARVTMKVLLVQVRV